MPQDFPAADPHLDALVLRALERCGLSPSLARSVAALVPRRLDDWRVCCGSDCDPCVVPLARAVDMVRAELDAGALESQFDSEDDAT
jgi:hypothetical protein